jgi:hypothetical protein
MYDHRPAQISQTKIIRKREKTKGEKIIIF